MPGKGSRYGESWADQWDLDNGDYSSDGVKKKENLTAKYGKKVGEGFGKTKAAASTSIKKVKEGTSVGIQWIKDKYQKTAHKN